MNADVAGSSKVVGTTRLFFCVSTLGFSSSQVSGKREKWLMIVAEILVMMLIRGTCVRIFSFLLDW